MKKGFTLIEIIVSITILIILVSISFISFNSYIKDSRDASRISNLTQIQESLKNYNVSSSKYPDLKEVTGKISANGFILGSKGNLTSDILNKLKFNNENAIKDPLNSTGFVYGLTYKKNEYQIATVLEKKDMSYLGEQALANTYNSYVVGNYNGDINYTTGGVKYIAQVPSLVYNLSGATNSGSLDIINDKNNIYYVTNGGENLAYKIDNTTQINSKIINPNKKAIITETTDLYALDDYSIKSIFDTGSFYTQNWTGNVCNPDNIQVVDFYNAFSGVITKVGTGYNINSAINLASNTIYRVGTGTYTLSGSTINKIVSQNQKCVGFIGKNINENLFSTNFTSGGKCTGEGEINVTYGTNNNIFYGFSIKGDYGSTYCVGRGILLQYGSYNNTFRYINSYNNEYTGFSVFDSSNNNNFFDIKTYNNKGHGIAISSSSNNYFKNIEIFGHIFYTNSDGIYIGTTSGYPYSFSNKFLNIKNYSNSYGIELSAYNDFNTFSNISFFNNYYGVYNSASKISFNNSLFFNNNYGDDTYKDFSLYSNSFFFNNYNYGLKMYNGTNLLLNNFSAYNNGKGIFLNSFSGSMYSFYNGYLKLFGNTTNLSLLNSSFPTPLPILSDTLTGSFFKTGKIYYNGTLPSGYTGTLDNSFTMSCDRHIQPNLVSNWGTNCNTRGQFSTGLTLPVTSYKYGKNVPYQQRPVRYNSTTNQLEYYGVEGVDYDSTKQIGQW